VLLLLETMLLSFRFSPKDPQTHSNNSYCMIKNVSIDEDEVTAEEISAAIPDVISPHTLEGNEEASLIEEVY
jgi:molecular chaperone HtpG